MTDLSLTVERVISAPPERVFDAWLNPQMLMRFMTPGPSETCPKATSDAVEGRRFEIIMRGERDLLHSGTYQEITRHSRLVFTWESPFSVPASTVTLDFQPEGSGTRLTLTHVKFQNEEMRDNHTGGWTAILEALGTAVQEAADA